MGLWLIIVSGVFWLVLANHAFGQIENKGDHAMLLYPAKDKNKRITMLAETHRIKGGSQVVKIQPPQEFPFMSIYEGKDNNPYADFTEYQPKLDRFYARQGQYFLANPNMKRPVIPGFADLDGGIHGHSGTYHKNGMSTDIRDNMDQGHVIQYIDGKGMSYGLFLDAGKTKIFVYDTLTASPRQFFTKAAVDYDNYRMSTARSAKVAGDSQFKLSNNGWGDQKLRYHGHFRYLTEAVFSYQVNNTKVLEAYKLNESNGQHWISQHLLFPNGSEALTYLLDDSLKKAKGELSEKSGIVFLTYDVGGKTQLIAIDVSAPNFQVDVDGELKIDAVKSESTLAIAYWAGDKDKLGVVKAAITAQAKNFAAVAKSLPSKTKGSPKTRWGQTFSGKGVLADESNFKTPYVIDTLPVPVRNPFKSPMVLSGIAFHKKGDAYVATMFGDIWKVSGITGDLKNITWKRMIAGLNSPFGLTYADGKLYVGDKAELIALHDLNGDDEFDFVERVNQGFRPNHRNVHAGAPRDSKGAFYYVTSSGVKKLHDDKMEHFSPATRTAMGIGVTHEDRVWSAPQEGDWTPASAIYEQHKGDDVYRPNSRVHKTIAHIKEALDPALVYIPRGIDNSTGGFATVRSDRFGLLGDKMLNLSWGACSAQLVLRDKPEGANRYQGAVIPLEGNYIAGLRYAEINPKDGQLYLVGHDGWGTYSVSDGCLQRLRYTGGPVYFPTSFRTYTNGIKIGFDEKLDQATVENVKNLFVQQWNYVYSNAYGSPEYSVKNPKQEGHDVLTAQSAYLLADGKTIFIEVPDIDPAMNVHVYGQLKSASNQEFELNIVMTALYLQDEFAGYPGYKKTNAYANKKQQLDLPVMITGLKPKKIHKDVRQKSTLIEVGVNDRLQFIFDDKNKKLLDDIKVGDSIIFKVKNVAASDGIAHNALVIDKKDTQLIGTFCDTHSSTLEAKRNSYVPLYDKDMKAKVHAYSILIAPGQTDEFVYEVKTGGDMTLICTFPGHWAIMRVDFTVAE